MQKVLFQNKIHRVLRVKVYLVIVSACQRLNIKEVNVERKRRATIANLRQVQGEGLSAAAPGTWLLNIQQPNMKLFDTGESIKYSCFLLSSLSVYGF